MRHWLYLSHTYRHESISVLMTNADVRYTCTSEAHLKKMAIFHSVAVIQIAMRYRGKVILHPTCTARVSLFPHHTQAAAGAQQKAQPSASLTVDHRRVTADDNNAQELCLECWAPALQAPLALRASSQLGRSPRKNPRSGQASQLRPTGSLVNQRERTASSQ